MNYRLEQEQDRDAVYAVNVAAFPGKEEAQLVDKLRETAEPLISLVAEDNGQIIGHILFSPVTLDSDSTVQLMGLAPMAVLPPYQKQGIGSRLVTLGLEHCQLLGAGAVVVLGHPAFYPRFGFTPATGFGIKSEYDVPPEVFMVTELQPGYLSGNNTKNGTISYHQAFGDL